MKRAIASLFSALSSKGTSHNSGFARILSFQMKVAGLDHDVLWTDQGGQDVDWNEYDEIYLYHGLDMNGKLSLNLFGGTCEPNCEKLKKLAFYQGKLIPLHYEMPDYVALGERAWPMPESFWTTLKKRLSKARKPFVLQEPSSHMAIGDSHVMSAWVPGQRIEVWSGQTMHGFIGNQHRPWYRVHKGLESVTLYFGNIDVRHHLCRQPDPVKAAINLTSQYVREVRRLQQQYLWKRVELVELSPIESEDREIPGPGCYKGQPFHGSWEERNNVRSAINAMLLEASKEWFGWSFYRHPEHWVQPDGRMDQQHMERPRSVHIAPQHYRAAPYLFT